MDHMRHDSTNFSGLEMLVLDEADRMLDMGFWPDVQRILSALPAERQTLLFSATMPAEVLKLTQEFLRDPKYVQVGRRGGPAQTISHAVQTVAARREDAVARATGCARRRPGRCSCSAARRSAPIAWRRA